MKWILIRNHGNQKCSQQTPPKTHKVIAILQKNQGVIIYRYILSMKINFITHKLAFGTHIEWIINRDEKQNKFYQKIAKKKYYMDRMFIPK